MITEVNDSPKITHVRLCDCGAITFEYEGNLYYCKNRNLKKHVSPKMYAAIRKRQHKDKHLGRHYSCNHCVNCWGLDVCACGSKLPPEKCNNGYDTCGRPWQSLGDKFGYYCKTVSGWLKIWGGE